MVVKYGGGRRDGVVDQASGAYNAEGFVFDCHEHANVYALTS